MLFGAVVKRTALAFILVLLFSAIAGTQFVNLTGANSEGNPVLTPTELWNFTVANSTANTIRISWMRPAIVDGVVYIGEKETYTIPEENYHDHFGFGPHSTRWRPFML